MVKRRRIVRKRGAGFGDFISGTLGGLGSGLGSGVKNIFSGLFGGGKRRRVRRRYRGGAETMPSEPTSLLGKINKVAKDSQVISKALKQFNLPFADSAALLGYGRKRRVRRRRVGGSMTTVSRGGRGSRMLYM